MSWHATGDNKGTRTTGVQEHTMNPLTQKTLRTLVLGTALIGASVTAQADDNFLTQRVATGVGRIIAAQGNAALNQIREELREVLNRSVEPLPPESADTAAPASVTTTDITPAASRLTL